MEWIMLCALLGSVATAQSQVIRDDDGGDDEG